MADEDVQILISDPDQALIQWYQGFMSPASGESTLTGGPLPSLDKLGSIFEQWVDRRRDDLRSLLCEKFGYIRMQPVRREVMEITVVAAISAVIASSHLGGQVDPVATAALLLSRRSLDGLCGEPDGTHAVT